MEAAAILRGDNPIWQPEIELVLVGVPRFELGTSSSQTKRATVLRHTPVPKGYHAPGRCVADGIVRALDSTHG